MSQYDINQILADIDEAEQSLYTAKDTLRRRTEEARRVIKDIDDHLPKAIVQALVSGDRERLNSLHALRVLAQRDLEDVERVDYLLNQRLPAQVDRRKALVQKGELDYVPLDRGGPRDWWPELFARQETHEDMRTETLRLLAEGHSQSEVSRRLGIHRRTVQRYAERAEEQAGEEQDEGQAA